jgi:peptide chain release factor 1
VIANEKKAAEPSKELIDMATMEMEEFYSKVLEIEDRMQTLLVPADPDVDKNALLEVRAGVGGDEACLFAEDIFKMYKLYAINNGWKFTVISVQDGNTGGYKEASASITGDNVYGKLKWESGVHRVQRVPVTEGSGRIHTSAMTVAVLPEVEETDFVISPADLKIDVYKASGAGGQHVNTTESAVRITHIPSGLVVTNQNERSQHQNKAMAMKQLRSQLYDNHKSKQVNANAELRASQIGSGDRSERIRTYNFPDDRVTDHRINKTVNNLGKVLRGEALDELIDEIRKVITSKKLEAMIKRESK